MVALDRRQLANERQSAIRQSMGRGTRINVHVRRRKLVARRMAHRPALRVGPTQSRFVYAIAMRDGRHPQDIVAEAVQRTVSEAVEGIEPTALRPLSEQGFRQVMTMLEQPPSANRELRDLLSSGK